MRRSANGIWGDSGGAVAPTVALSLFALIAVGGVAFDYARLATLDSELQNAADQSALAAASQLDGESGACSRAANAAVSLTANETRFGVNAANTSTAITVPLETTCDADGNVRFYTDKTKATPATTDATARFVEVTVNARTARYALTPIVGAFNSGAIAATALAGLGSSICKVPPVMICNPQETAGSTTFNIALLRNKGLRLVSVGANGGWAPGNFGYLDSSAGSNGAPGLREALGWTAPPGDCQPESGVDTKPGATVTVTDALNTRFDIYDGDVPCPSGGVCPASINSVKDLVRPGNANGNNACKLHNQGWQILDEADRYWPTSATTPLASTITPKAMGHPRDICHAADDGAAGYCSSPIGDGVWDRDAYFRANYGWNGAEWPTYVAQGVLSARITTSTPTRFQVYSWEIANRGTFIGGVEILGNRVASGSGPNALTASGSAVCSAGEGMGGGVVPGGAAVDRRRISVAVVNCLAQSVNGASNNLTVVDWLDVFLVEPSIDRGDRTGKGDVYVEVIGVTPAGGGASAGQVVRRDVPYLVE